MKGLKILLALGVAAGLCWFAFYKSPAQRKFEKAYALAQQGDSAAMLQTADFFAAGTGTAPSAEQAQVWYRKALLAGHPQAAWKLSQFFRSPASAEPDLEEASAYLQLAAQDGFVPAQTELARFYQEGKGGLVQHAGEALYWYLAAAEKGDETAQLAVEQVRGQDPQLYEQVMQFKEILSAAQRGDGPSRLKAGQAYRKGAPLLQNPQEAFRWLQLAWTENQLAQAGLELAEIYLEPSSPQADEGKGLTLLGELAKQPYAPAQYALGERAYRQDPPNYKDAFAWFSNAAAGGHAPAQYMTGFMLLQGQGVEQSVSLAEQFFRKSAEQDYPSAQYVLGQIYYKGLGVRADKKTGKLWLERAVQNGSTAAQHFLDTL